MMQYCIGATQVKPIEDRWRIGEGSLFMEHLFGFGYIFGGFSCNAREGNTKHKNAMKEKLGGELEKVAWGILIDGQTSLDPAYIRNESLIN